MKKYLTVDERLILKDDQIITLRQRVQELEKEQVAWRKFTERANNTVSAAEAERDALKKLYESSEEYVIALKETRNRLAEERDEWRSKHDVACLTITNLQSKYECQLSATSKAMQGVVELTAERDALKQELEDFESDIDTCTQHNVELQLEVIKLTAERDGLLKSMALAMPVMDAHAGPSRLADFHAAIASVKEK